MKPLRIGIDLGGTKIAAIALGRQGKIAAQTTVPTPHGNYEATLEAIRELIASLENDLCTQASVGVGMPGSISPETGLVQNANSTWLNGRPFDKDLECILGRPVRLANDANCFALSEATDGAGKDLACVFGVILGTGCGGGIVRDGAILDGPRGIAGEWGHNPLPWPDGAELPGPECWCGRHGCMECWVSGPALSADHMRHTGEQLDAREISRRANKNNRHARSTLARHASRLARGLASVINIIDPDVVVLGGGLSQMPHLYETLPDLLAAHIFADSTDIAVRPPIHGSGSGVRGAAWLWGGPDGSFSHTSAG
ncbi:MAG: ROK family protein [Hyphomicrobiales bacterium]|nr:ROK family protein [Hyphomicrobiales bacterium]